MRAILLIILISLPGCGMLKKMKQTQAVRDEVLSTVHIPKDSTYTRAGAPVLSRTEVFHDTVTNIETLKYYYTKTDTVHVKTFDSEKTDALQRLYYQEQGETKAAKAILSERAATETKLWIAIAILTGIVILNAKFKFL